MKKIPLTGKNGSNQYALVDDKDYARASKMSWHLAVVGYPKNIKNGLGSHKEREVTQTYLHHFIIGKPQKGFVVDHKNGDKLDNRRDNLRLGTHGQNHANQGLQKNNTSGHKGVISKDGRWIARIKFDGRNKYIGVFTSKKQAALAYNIAARELFGEFALLNKI